MEDESESCRRAVQALSEICSGSTIRTLASDFLPDPIVDASERYTADFEVRGTYTPTADQWGDSFDKMSSATGLYLPTERVMFVDNRSTVHHNDQWNRIIEEMGCVSPVLPWASATRGDKFIVELGRSHGGLFQAVSRSDCENVERLSTGFDIKPEYVLDVAYAARLTDHPAGSTEYEVDFADESVRNLPEEIKQKLASRREILEMANVYDLLRATPEGLPEPLFDRSKL